MTALDVVAAIVLMASLVLLLEVTHRRTNHLPRAPFGADPKSEASFAYRREIAELRELERLDRS